MTRTVLVRKLSVLGVLCLALGTMPPGDTVVQGASCFVTSALLTHVCTLVGGVPVQVCDPATGIGHVTCLCDSVEDANHVSLECTTFEGMPVTAGTLVTCTWNGLNAP